MRISDFKVFRYQVPLSRPFPGQENKLQQREGFILQLKDERGNTGLGETAPLPGSSQEMPEVVLSQLRDLKKQLTGQEVPPNVEKLEHAFGDWFAKTPLAPSVRFGIESAVLTLRAGRSQKPLAELLDEDYQTDLALNTLLHGLQKDILNDARSILSQGFTTLKLKVGGMALDAAIETVNQLTGRMDGHAILRIDANKAWSFEDAVKFGKSVDYGVIEYIEEPLQDFSRTQEFYHEVMIPVAVDESLKTHSLKEIKSIEGIEIVIIKPTVIGGLEKSYHMLREAKGYGIRSVVSSSFESGVGIRVLANFSASLSRHVAAGLDTGRWFKTDVAAPLKIERGHLRIEDCQLNDLKLNSAVLQEV